MNAEVQSVSEGPEVVPVKTALVQMEVTPGNPDLNVARMLEYIEEAKTNGDEILVFPEMCVPGYLISDDWLDSTLVKDFEAYNQTILDATKGSDLVVVWGNVRTDSSKVNEDGSLRKYNAVFVAQDGVLLGERYKTALPNYGEFDDKRYFHSAAQKVSEEGGMLEQYLTPVKAVVKGTKLHIGAAICEDGWGSGEANDYAFDVMEMLQDNGANVCFNLSCSPVKNGKNLRRNKVFGAIAARGQVPLGYVNNVGTQNTGKNIIPFDGASTFYKADGSVQVMKDDYQAGVVRSVLSIPQRSSEAEAALTQRMALLEAQDQERRALQEKFAVQISDLTQAIRFDDQGLVFDPSVNLLAEDREAQLENLYQMLLSGIKNFFETSGLKRVVIGLSGGADSALVAKLMVDALGAENVYGVNIPTTYNSDLTKGFAFTLAQELGINYGIFPLQASYESTVTQLGETGFISMSDQVESDQVPVAGALDPSDVNVSRLQVSPLNQENIQARKRGSEVLAGIASTLGAVFTNNGNKSETAVGYCTVDGDLAGALAPIGDLYKTEVYALMRYLADKNGTIPTLGAIADSIPSAELSADQDIDKGQGDPFDYYYHDKLMYQLIEMRQNPADILRWYEAGELPEKLGLEAELPAKFCGTTADFISDLERINRLIKSSVFKRVQGQPIIRVSRKGFGFDLRESMLQGPLYYTQGYRELKSQLLTA